jgi:hypothetical protein
MRNGTGSPYLFRSYDHQGTSVSPFERNPGDADDFTIAEVAKAISAPPVFKPIELKEGRYLDGSRSLRNPTWEVFNEIATLPSRGKVAVDLLLSLGTGDKRVIVTDIIWKLGLWSADKALLKSSKSSKPSDSVHERMLKLEKDEQFLYRRLTVPKIPGGYFFEESGRKRRNLLKEIEKVTEEYLRNKDVQEILCECANILVQRRRARAETSRWEAFAMGTRYRCMETKTKCFKKETRFLDREELLDHLVKDHNLPPPDPISFQRIEDLLDRGRVQS